MMITQQTNSPRPRVVIIGGGFGGLHAAAGLKKAPVAITLIDQRNYHLFQPLLYQVATAELEPNNIAFPIRKIVRKQKNCDVVLGEVVAIDLAGSWVEVNGGRIPYDYLILATGSRQSYFGHDEYRRHAPGLNHSGHCGWISPLSLLPVLDGTSGVDPGIGLRNSCL